MPSHGSDAQASMQEIRKDVIIIGAGAAGLMCAVECGKRGRSVLTLDHGRRAGSKLLVSGGGRCNFTNLHVTADHYRSDNPHFCKSALARCTPQHILSLVKKHGIAYYEKEAGQIFCRKTSRDIVDLFEQECREVGAQFLYSCRIQEIERTRDYIVRTNEGNFRASSLVVATGGLSYPGLGASGFGHDLARQFGLRITKVSPALVPFMLNLHDRRVYGALAGASLECCIRIAAKSFCGNLLFTHSGLSGPAALQASLFWEPGSPLVIDLLPKIDILKVLMDRRRSAQELRTLLATYFPKRFAQTWCAQQIDAKPIRQYSEKELRAISELLHGWEIIPAGTEGYKTAEVTAGGVDTNELSSQTMMAKKAPGLFFIGEVVDVTGQLGGYNLQWAWASGYAAGQYA